MDKSHRAQIAIYSSSISTPAFHNVTSPLQTNRYLFTVRDMDGMEAMRYIQLYCYTEQAYNGVASAAGKTDKTMTPSHSRQTASNNVA